MGSVPLRRRLFLLVAAGILPLALCAAAGLVALVRLQRLQVERTGRELTRALATAVSGELRRVIAVVETVNTSPTLDGGDLAGFLRRIDRVIVTQPGWLAILLADPSGTTLLRTGSPLGTTLPAVPEPDVLAEVVRTRRPIVGNLAPGTPDWPSFGVYVPVVAGDAVRYVTVALVRPDAVAEILRRQGVPADWVISIFDRRGLRVARSRLHEQYLGTAAAPSLIELMSQPTDEGWGPTIALEGDALYTAYTRLPELRWSVATGVPQRAVDVAANRSAIALTAGLLLSVLIGGAAAFAIARGITGPMRALRRAATAFGRGTPAAPPASRIEEIRRVGEALAAAAAERARGEAERDAMLRREQDARSAAEHANRAKDEFLAMLGHELRNPVGAISNAVALLERADAPDDLKRRTWPIIARQTTHLLRLTNDLLEAGRAMTGKIVLHRQPLDLASAVGQALRTLQITGRIGGRRLITELVPVWCDADPTRIEQIVANLVGNAIKFTTPTGAITVQVARAGDDASLIIADDGAGMEPEVAAHAFDLFAQGRQPLDRSEGGLGIGLTLVQRLAELHGGSAAVASPGPGQGTTVEIRLPAVAPPAAAQADGATTAAPAGGRDVLVVEDNEDARTSLCILLELFGHRVRTAGDGYAAVAAATGSPPDVAVIDVGLPGIDGYEVARRIRAAIGSPRPLLLAITGYGLPEDRQRALDAGFDAHLVKPIDPHALERLLRTLPEQDARA